VVYKNLTGRRFGELTALSISRKDQRGHMHWRCLCSCGNTTVVHQGNLGRTTNSCGCKRTIHHMSHTRTYRTWISMKSRCYRPTTQNYKWYGALGVRVCRRWLNNFKNFLEDMGERPPGMTIDRINGSGDYTPSSCRWATPAEQRLNRRNNCSMKGKAVG
jgi:hypothetical protein